MNKLYERFPIDKIKNIVIKRSTELFPDQDEIKELVDNELNTELIDMGNKYLDFDYPIIPVSRNLDFYRDGDRKRFETLYFKRREAVCSLLLAYYVSQDDKYIENMLNGIWAICEESSWCLPAHYFLYRDTPPLPLMDDVALDLFAAQTGAYLSAAYIISSNHLNKISPIITQRIKSEVLSSVVYPFLNRTDYWWLGYDENRRLNNWTPWIVSNCLRSGLTFLDDKDEISKLIHKSLYCLSKFMDEYPNDGGCDEGPTYWGKAAGSLYDCLDIIYEATSGVIDLFDIPLIKNMGEYFVKAHVSNEWFLNFADCPAKIRPDSEKVYAFGKRLNSDILINLGGRLFHDNARNGEEDFRHPFMMQRHLLGTRNEIINNSFKYPLIKDVYLNDTQLMAARYTDGDDKGLFLAAKSGHNAESHNHNDVGSFVVYNDGYPILIDAGVGDYTKFTFSEKRYEIWTMRSLYHNLPAIGGYEQLDGRNKFGEVLKYECGAEHTLLHLDISNAYDDKAKVKQLDTKYMLNRSDKFIKLEYNIELLDKMQISFHFMTATQPDILDKGKLRLHYHDLSHATMEYDEDVYDITIEKIDIDKNNSKLYNSWGDSVYRIVFDTKEKYQLLNRTFLIK